MTNHIRRITKNVPASASLGGESKCKSAAALANILTAFGGSSPYAEFVVEKCDLPPDYFDGGAST